MITIQLSQEKISIIDNEDIDLSYLTWSAKENKKGSGRFIAVRRTGGRLHSLEHKLHRVVLSRMLGRDLLSEEEVDHVDRDPLNNQRANLRLATRTQNNANKGNISHTSVYRGVSWDKSRNKWFAGISYNHKTIPLGRFNDEKEAARAYNQKAVELYGDFAMLNEC